jgi:hypothetical protein
MAELATSRGTKTREERLRVMLPARIRSGSGWSDACILNISSRGLLVYSNMNAKPGSFIELRRGGQLVIARVVWRKNQRIGLCSPDPVHVQDIISSETAAAAVVQGRGASRAIERRRVPRGDERSRERARAIEFLATVLIGTALAGAAAVSMHRALAAPLAHVRTALQAP